MRLADGMSLFHGSYACVTEVDLERCFAGKDFGRGFYLTSDAKQAQRFIPASLRKARDIGQAPDGQNFGFVSRFKFVEPATPLRVFEFDGADGEWLWFVSANRRASIAGKLACRIPSEALEADVVVGKVANDTTNPVIAAYLNGLYGPVDSERAVRIAVENLLPNKLTDQFCFKTASAVSCLRFEESIRYDV